MIEKFYVVVKVNSKGCGRSVKSVFSNIRNDSYSSDTMKLGY